MSSSCYFLGVLVRCFKSSVSVKSMRFSRSSFLISVRLISSCISNIFNCYDSSSFILLIFAKKV